MTVMSGIKRKISYGKTFNYMVKEYDSHDELYQHLKKGDKVLVQERANDDINFLDNPTACRGAFFFSFLFFFVFLRLKRV